MFSRAISLITQLEKLAALCRRYLREGKLIGSTTSHFTQFGDIYIDERATLANVGGELEVDGEEDQDKQAIEKHSVSDAGPDAGPQSLSSINLAARPERSYPKQQVYFVNPYIDHRCHGYEFLLD